ncbi:VCBS repeat-containing protein [Candidatus Bipolaricaulota bacterium]|nr:VCBS repeat-containing protein [Candidatus Bipolaricaulota bacterium]
MKRPREPEGRAASAISAVDFDLDGTDDDLAVTQVEGNTVGNVVFLFGKGDGTFSPFVKKDGKILRCGTSVGKYPLSVAASPKLEDRSLANVVVANFAGSSLSGFLVDRTHDNIESGNPETTLLEDIVGGFGQEENDAWPSAVALHNWDNDPSEPNKDMKDMMVVSDRLHNKIHLYLYEKASEYSTKKEFKLQGQYKTGLSPDAIVVGDFNGVGDKPDVADVAIANYGSNNVTIWLSTGSCLLTHRITIPVGKMPTSIAAGYFDGWKVPEEETEEEKAARLKRQETLDLAITNFGSGNITILLNRGDETFETRIIEEYEGEGPISIVAFDGENGSDLAVANFVSNNVTILQGNGDGTFVQEVRKEGIADGPVALAVGEFNEETGLDLAVAVQFPIEPWFTEEEIKTMDFHEDVKGSALTQLKDEIKQLRKNVFIVPDVAKHISGDEHAKTTPEPIPEPTGESTAIALASGDLNQDRHSDLAVLTLITPEGEPKVTEGRISILHGSDRTDSSLSLAGNSLTVEEWSSILQAGDMDNDGRTDLVVLATGANQVAFRWGPGLDQIHTERVNIAPATLAVGTFSSGSWTLAGSSVLISTSHGRSFVKADLDLKGSRAIAAAAAVNLTEMDRGPPDLVVLDNASRILTFRGSDLMAIGESPNRVSLASTRSLLEYGAASALAIGDFDDDGRYDLAVVFSNSDEGTILFGAGAKRRFPTGDDSPNALAVGDFNNDGYQDIAVGKAFSEKLAILYGTGNGFFSEGPPVKLGAAPRDRGLLIADLNGDRRSDIAAVHENADYITILYNTMGPIADEIQLVKGAERITVRQRIFHPQEAVSVEWPIEPEEREVERVAVPEEEPQQREPELTEPTVGAFVARGKLRMVAKVEAAKVPDLIVVCQESDTLSFLSGTGRREDPFVWERALELGMGARDIALGDFDGDSHSDVAVVNTAANSVTILWEGDHSKTSVLSTAVAPSAIAVADFNADTYQDLAVICQRSNKITVFLSQGSARDFVSIPVVGPDSPGAITVADLNGDSRDDLVATDLLRGRVVFFLNTTATQSGIISFDSYSANLPSSHTCTALLMANDVDRDGALDVVVLGRAPSKLFVFLNDGFGNFSQYSAYPAGQSWQDASLSDFTGNGFPDLVLVDGFSGVILLYSNQGDGSFAERPIVFLAGEDPYSIAPADFDQDGILDLVVANTAGKMYLLWGIEGETAFEKKAAEVVIRRQSILE